MRIASSYVDEPFFKELVSALPGGVIAVDETGTIIFATPAVEQMLGYTPDDILELPIEEFFPDQESPPLERLLQEMDSDRISLDQNGMTDSLLDKRDNEIPVRLFVNDTQYDDQRVVIIAFQEDPRNHQQERLRQGTEQHLRKLFENTSDGVVVFNPETDEIVDCNSRFCEMLECTREELVSLSPSDLHSDEIDRFHRYVEQVLEGGAGWLDNISCRTPSGDSIPVEIFAVRIEMNGCTQVIANVRDISARKVHEERLEALNESSRRLMVAETETEIADIAIEVVQAVFGRSLTAVWTVNDGEDVLHPLATSEKAVDLSRSNSTDMLGPITPGTAEMAVFQAGETTLLTEYDTVESPAHPEMGLKTRLVAPLGEHGLLAVGSTSAGDIDPALRELVEILARATQAAFERLSREQAIRHRSTAIGAASDGMGISNQDGKFTYANDALAELSGYDDPNELVGASWRRLYEDDEIARFESEVLPSVQKQGQWQGEATGRRADGTTYPQEISLSTLDDGGLVCIVRDITARKKRERQLKSLNDVAHKLMKADTREEIVSRGVEALADVFDFEVACIRLLDQETERLEPIALTDGAEDLLTSYTAYDLEATLAGHAFRTGETLSTVSFDGTEPLHTFEYPSYHIPLESYGVLSVILTEDESGIESEIQLTEMLAVNIRTAIARAERNRLIKDHEHELRQQRDQLETLNRINTLVQIIEKRLTEATTRTELEETICEHLAGSNLYTSAWTGDTEISGDRITTRVGAGIADGDLNAIAEMPLSSVENGTVKQAIESKEVQVVRQYRLIGNETDDEPREVKATAAIPLIHGERAYGVLVVHSANKDAFSEKAISGFESLGMMTGFAINAIKNRDILLSDSIVELEFEVADPHVFYVQVTNELDCTCRFDRSIPLEGGKVMHYHTIEGANLTDVIELIEEFDHIEKAKPIVEYENSFVLQTITSESTVQIALQVGATIRSAVANKGTAQLVVEAPQSADVREIVEQFERAFSRLELVSKRERERSIRTADEFRETVVTELTEKQQAAIESAYFSGYYDWPRKITAEELAESMDISSATLHQHLRRGVRSLLSGFLEDDGE